MTMWWIDTKKTPDQNPAAKEAQKQKEKQDGVKKATDALKNTDVKTVNAALKPALDKMQKTDLQKFTDDPKIQNNPKASEIVDLVKQWKVVEAVTLKIDSDPTMKDPETNKIAKLLKEWKILEAISEWFTLLFNSIFGDGNGNTELFFPQFEDLNKYIAEMNLDTKSLPELENLTKEFEEKIGKADSVKRKISYTYILSAIKVATEKKQNPETNLIKITEKQLEVGSVILLNKQKAGTWWKLLQGVSKDDVDFTHVIVITEKWPPPKFSHATEHKYWNSAQSGIETNVPLWDYLKGNYADIVITQPPQEAKQKLIARLPELQKDENLQYSKTAAATGILGINDVQKWKYNCGSYVQEILWLDGKWLAVPANWLANNKMKPTFMFTFEPDKQGS